jgi:hypothetical protein
VPLGAGFNGAIDEIDFERCGGCGGDCVAAEVFGVLSFTEFQTRAQADSNTAAPVAKFHLDLFHNGTSGRIRCIANAAGRGRFGSIACRANRTPEPDMAGF